MSPFDDDLDAMTTGAGGAAPLIGQFLVELRAFGDGQAPTPSAELSAAFAGATVLRGRRRRRLSLIAAAAAVLLVVGVGAATTRLPQPAQSLVSRLVNVLTPYHLDPAREPARAPVLPVPVTTPGSHRTTAPAPPSPTPTDDSPAPSQDVPAPSPTEREGGTSGSTARPGSDDTSGAPCSAPTRTEPSDGSGGSGGLGTPDS